jgi:hypothetical protein
MAEIVGLMALAIAAGLGLLTFGVLGWMVFVVVVGLSEHEDDTD